MRRRVYAALEQPSSRVGAERGLLTIPDMTVLVDAALKHREREVLEHFVAASVAV